MKRRAVKAESAVPASGAAAPSPDDIPVVHVPKRPRTQKLSELDDLDLGDDDLGGPPPKSGGMVGLLRISLSSFPNVSCLIAVLPALSTRRSPSQA